MSSRKKLLQRVKPVATVGKEQSATHAFTGSLSTSGTRFTPHDHADGPRESLRGSSTLQYSLNAQNPVDESTPEGEGFYQQDLTPDDDIHVNEIIRANEVDEDLENYILESTHQTRGQNYMLSSWLHDHSAQYCETLFEAEHISSEESSCAGCTAASSLYKCRNCHSDALLCKTCIVDAHSALPTHRIRMWTGQFFQDETLSGLGAVLHLGHGGRKCTNGHDRSLYLGSTNGFHFINVRYCRHPGADKD
ncbi:hypothetical protein BDV93DRAFT_555184 [Ceratobasidium sp. AG-I]|nr:hypothetical protein BDV93DRAFT_555184 [Ceratobasidium sp. AG-I]